MDVDNLICATSVVNQSRVSLVFSVGIQMKLEFFQRKFWIASRQCATLDGKCPISCDDEVINCYLIDNNGFILVSEDYRQTGNFFGEVEGAVMNKLLNMGSFKRITLYDYQAMCRTTKESSDSAQSLLDPYRAIFAAIKWMMTELILFLVEFNLCNWWNSGHSVKGTRSYIISLLVASWGAGSFSAERGAEAQRLKQVLEPCDTEYPAFVSERTIKETMGSVACDDCFKTWKVNREKPDVGGAIIRCRPIDDVPHAVYIKEIPSDYNQPDDGFPRFTCLLRSPDSGPCVYARMPARTAHRFFGAQQIKGTGLGRSPPGWTLSTWKRTPWSKSQRALDGPSPVFLHTQRGPPKCFHGEMPLTFYLPLGDDSSIGVHSRHLLLFGNFRNKNWRGAGDCSADKHINLQQRTLSNFNCCRVNNKGTDAESLTLSLSVGDSQLSDQPSFIKGRLIIHKQQIPSSNLFMVVVDNVCSCDSFTPITMAPIEIRYILYFESCRNLTNYSLIENMTRPLSPPPPVIFGTLFDQTGVTTTNPQFSRRLVNKVRGVSRVIQIREKRDLAQCCLWTETDQSHYSGEWKHKGEHNGAYLSKSEVRDLHSPLERNSTTLHSFQRDELSPIDKYSLKNPVEMNGKFCRIPRLFTIICMSMNSSYNLQGLLSSPNDFSLTPFAHNESLKCERLKSQKIRRRPEACHGFHPEENARECGGAFSISPQPMTVLLSLLMIYVSR
ncbi:hypothetical protein XELAEV_18001790mg [Xenopus laevis]|nr:hypothetical protein XELAEV_18001790mg [Xenopus laevis]